MKKIMIFLSIISSVFATNSPTSSPFYIVYPGQGTSMTSKCLGIPLGPYRNVRGDVEGVCASEKVGPGCRWACIHDPEGESPCKNFPGDCIRCKRGFKLKKGICYRKK
jgi:hypothetical protein